MQPFRALAPLVAWAAAVVCGWKAAQHGDLLDAVLRGAVAWLGVLVIWLVGVHLCEQLIEVGVRADSTKDE